MKRFLFNQMRHEWRDNLWMVIELMIVGIVICSLTYLLAMQIRNLNTPLGFEFDNVYRVSVNQINPNSPEAVSAETKEETDAMNLADFRTILSLLRSNPMVEAVAISQNAAPFNYNYAGNYLHFKGLPDSIGYPGNMRLASPDIVNVLRLNPEGSMTRSQMFDHLKRGEIFISRIHEKALRTGDDGNSLVGKESYFGDSTQLMKVAGTIPMIRRSSYEVRSDAGMILVPFNEETVTSIWDIPSNEWLIRIKDGQGQAFEKSFAETTAMKRLRNITLSDLKPLSSLRLETERGEDMQVRLYVAMLIFFLAIIFLGLLGTFWYRVQQRSGEIALRKVAGATRKDILRRLMSEATILLILGFIPGLAIIYIYFYKTIAVEMGIFTPWDLTVVAAILSLVIMESMILLGVLFPARRAMAIEPAIALKDE